MAEVFNEEKLLAQLKVDEGFSDTPYRDTEGYLTIGYGTVIEHISEAEACLLLEHRLRQYQVELLRAFPWVVDLPPSVRYALFSMVYNLGMPRLKKFKKMWAALMAHDYEKAAEEALDSKWAKQVGDRAGRLSHSIRAGKAYVGAEPGAVAEERLNLLTLRQELLALKGQMIHPLYTTSVAELLKRLSTMEKQAAYPK